MQGANPKQSLGVWVSAGATEETDELRGTFAAMARAGKKTSVKQRLLEWSGRAALRMRMACKNNLTSI